MPCRSFDMSFASSGCPCCQQQQEEQQEEQQGDINNNNGPLPNSNNCITSNNNKNDKNSSSKPNNYNSIQERQLQQQQRGYSNTNATTTTTTTTTTSYNPIFIQYTLTDFTKAADTNFWLALICLGVTAVNIVLLYLNWAVFDTTDDDDDENIQQDQDQDYNIAHISERTFHLMEFWTAHIYAVTEAYALVTSPKTMLNIYNKPNLLKLLLFFNVVNSLVPAILISLDTEYFERMAHEMEFCNEFTLSFVTCVLLLSLLQQGVNDKQQQQQQQPQNSPPSRFRQKEKGDETYDTSSLIMGIVACGVAALNFGVYNICREAIAHYLEFSFNITTALITFWFCMDNRFVAQMEIGQILYGQHLQQNCNLCKERSENFHMTQQQAPLRWQSLYGTNNNNNNNINNLSDLMVFTDDEKKELEDDEYDLEEAIKQCTNNQRRPTPTVLGNDEESRLLLQPSFG